MATPIPETLRTAVVTRLEAIDEGATYSFTAIPVGIERFTGNQPADGTIVVKTVLEFLGWLASSNGHQRWKLNVELHCFRYTKSSNETWDTVAFETVTDVLRTMGSLPLTNREGDIEDFNAEIVQGGVIITFGIVFETQAFALDTA